MRYLFFVIFCSALISCKSSQIINRKIDKKYDRNDLIYETLQTDSFQITYWDNHSNKPPLVLLHGFGTWSKFQWHKQVETLGQHYRLIIPNLLHFGKSTCTDCGYMISDQVNAIESLTKQLQIKNYNLCGASYGGVVAIELALKNQKLIEKLIIVDSPIKFFTSEEIIELQNYHNVQSIPQLLIPESHKELKELTKLLYKKPPITPTFLFKDVYDEMFTPFRNDMTKTLESMLDQRAYFAAQEYEFEFPILLIWGKEDKLVPLRVGESLHNYFGDYSKLEVIENTAHMPILEESKKCNQIITTFLNQ